MYKFTQDYTQILAKIQFAPFRFVVLLEKNKTPYMLPFLPKFQNKNCYVASMLMLDVFDSVPADCSVDTNYKFILVCQSVFDGLAK